MFLKLSLKQISDSLKKYPIEHIESILKPGFHWCEHIGELGPPFPLCKICNEKFRPPKSSPSHPKEVV